MAKFIRFISGVLLAAIALASFVFTYFNTAEVPLWLGRELPARPLGEWVVAAFAGGGLLGLLLGFGLFQQVRSRARIRQLEAQLEQAESTIADLKRRAPAAPPREP